MRGYIDIKRRPGIFYVKSRDIDIHPEVIMAIMGKMIIVRAERYWIADAVKYEAYSPLFDVRPDGAETPEYEIVWSSGDGGSPKIKAKKLSKDYGQPRVVRRLNVKADGGKARVVDGRDSQYSQ